MTTPWRAVIAQPGADRREPHASRHRQRRASEILSVGRIRARWRKRAPAKPRLLERGATAAATRPLRELAHEHVQGFINKQATPTIQRNFLRAIRKFFGVLRQGKF